MLKPDYSEVYYNQHGLSVNLDTALKFIERAHVTQPSNHNIMITNFGLKAIGGSSENFNSMDRKRFDKNPFKRSFDWFFELEKLPKVYFDRWRFFDDMIALSDTTRPFYEYGVWRGISFKYLIKVLKKDLDLTPSQGYRRTGIMKRLERTAAKIKYLIYLAVIL